MQLTEERSFVRKSSDFADPRTDVKSEMNRGEREFRERESGQRTCWWGLELETGEAN
jgi:hypothetical protein